MDIRPLHDRLIMKEDDVLAVIEGYTKKKLAAIKGKTNKKK